METGGRQVRPHEKINQAWRACCFWLSREMSLTLIFWLVVAALLLARNLRAN